MKAARTIFFLIAFSAVALQTGCTVALWKDTGHWDACKTPAQPNQLQVFEDPRKKDFLVVFEQESERTDAVRKRAYYLYASESDIERRKRPHFVSVRNSTGLAQVPVFQSADARTLGKPFIVSANDDIRFVLHSKDGEVTSHMLAVYSDKIGQTERIALTPVAVVVDATVIGAIIVVEAAAHSNWSGEGP